MVEALRELLEVLRTPRKLPMRSHGIQLQRVHERNEGLALAHHGRIGPVKRIAVVERNHAIGIVGSCACFKSEAMRA